jgi:hypothetical protein
LARSRNATRQVATKKLANWPSFLPSSGNSVDGYNGKIGFTIKASLLISPGIYLSKFLPKNFINQIYNGTQFIQSNPSNEQHMKLPGSPRTRNQDLSLAHYLMPNHRSRNPFLESLIRSMPIRFCIPGLFFSLSNYIPLSKPFKKCPVWQFCLTRFPNIGGM